MEEPNKMEILNTVDYIPIRQCVDRIYHIFEWWTHGQKWVCDFPLPCVCIQYTNNKYDYNIDWANNGESNVCSYMMVNECRKKRPDWSVSIWLAGMALT